MHPGSESPGRRLPLEIPGSPLLPARPGPHPAPTRRPGAGSDPAPLGPQPPDRQGLRGFHQGRGPRAEVGKSNAVRDAERPPRGAVGVRDAAPGAGLPVRGQARGRQPRARLGN
ncbi:cuticle collagen 14-like [Chionomys nivalis]|uniref:cuticle collagen 14-like n=1 Tax=Chionomys nivalis TaxID=269649 RepID=UPI002597AA1D|nr:cuticle collagen 14-like [Chionomys nivalis]